MAFAANQVLSVEEILLTLHIDRTVMENREVLITRRKNRDMHGVVDDMNTNGWTDARVEKIARWAMVQFSSKGLLSQPPESHFLAYKSMIIHFRSRPAQSVQRRARRPARSDSESDASPTTLRARKRPRRGIVDSSDSSSSETTIFHNRLLITYPTGHSSPTLPSPSESEDESPHANAQNSLTGSQRTDGVLGLLGPPDTFEDPSAQGILIAIF